MKKKLVTLFTLVLTATLLSGCGSNSQTGASSSGKNIDALSEHLSDVKTIGYLVDEMDKSKTPNNIYFFEKGKLSIIPGEEFELTLGDLSQMKDEEIWDKYENVRETYAKNYITKKEKDIEVAVNEKYQESIDDWKESVDALEAVRGKNYTDVSGDDAEIATTVLIMWIQDQSMVDESFQMTYQDELSKFGLIDDTQNYFSETLVDGCIKAYQDSITKAESEKTEYKKTLSYNGPFFDLPVSLIVETDSSGNYTETEKIVYPTLSDEIDSDVPSTYYDSLDIVATVEGADVQIYDTTYGCFPLDNGDTFCTRDLFIFDNAKSKDVLVDPSKDEIDKLYKAEVTARYK